eukprot:CAMPEP_0170555124 /NCGR_PEP_ID=MMETSP0211-20121228/13009_1 /TAXON_ID=311385 /ORGANISM="Pseudokeronopsis sp., Strain OXSARD2" /LENGTH=115 /DNA_ID=CAMNT_0010864731 /DNA_START=340 /DNA_END=684 /DNA_ORIENTATION=+
MKLNGNEYLLSFFYMVVLLVVLYYVPCQEDNSNMVCSYGSVENFPLALRELGDNGKLLILSIIIIVGSCITHTFAILAASLESSLAKVTIVVLKSLLLWTFFLIYNGPGHESFKW